MGSCLQDRPGGLVLVACISLLTASARAAPDFHEWADTSDVFMNTSAGGANLTSTMIGFPLLVRLDRSGFDFSKARGNGRDIRFSNSSGTPLPYHIERWDSAAGKAEIWVLADTVKGNNSTQHLRMYWNNPTAADSSNPAAVFPSSKGLVAVFHLGGSGTADRANSAAGGAAAATGNYEGDERKAGIIGYCDSLDGNAPGDYLNLGAGYADFAGGFTYSAWVYPTSVKLWSHFMDLGNPVTADNRGHDNIIIGREHLTNHLIMHNYLEGGVSSNWRVDGAITNGQWQHFTVTIANTDSSIRAYKNGSLIWSGKLSARLSGAHRVNNWLGRSGWSADEYFQGKFDEVRISRLPHSAVWIKASYENQRPDQAMITLRPPARCQSSFAPPADTVVNEGTGLALASRADCAHSYNWTPISGPAPRLPDPDVKVLQFTAPRVAGDTAIVFRFSAVFADSTRQMLVRVSIREAIPEPLFTMPASLGWNGRDSLKVSATVSNLAAIRATRDSLITWSWALESLDADTAWRSGALVLRNATSSGKGKVTLCLHNNGPTVCKSTEVTVTNPTSLRSMPAAVERLQGPDPRRDATGRWMPDRTRSLRTFPARAPRKGESLEKVLAP